MAALPDKIGQFEVLRQIGSGGMGAVYLGRDPELDRQVAIKVIREEVHDQEVLDRFFREARAAAALRHPNIITIYASGQHEHQPYMVMEFVDGESLADVIRKKRTLSLPQKISYLEQICAGLHFAHRAGIVHRDVKPANVMVDRDGMMRILDFGIARIEGSAMTQDGTLMGSLNYMSPEQMLGRPIDHRSDIFSVGSLAYELVTYQQAFKGSLNDGLLQRLPNEDPPPLHELARDVPWALEEVIMRALQKAPENRFQDLAEMRNALLAVQADAPRTPAPAEEERTIVIPRAALPQSDSQVLPPTPPSQVAPPSAFFTPPPAPSPFYVSAVPSTSAAPSPVSLADMGAMPGTSAAPTPSSQTWQVKRKTTQPATSAGKTAVDARPATTVHKTPAPRPPAARPDAGLRTSPRRWVAIAVTAGVLLIGGVAAIPWLTAPPVSVLERERPGIEAALERYRIGYRNRDLPAVTQAFPALPPQMRQTMERTFKTCLVYDVTFDDVAVQIAAGSDTTSQVTLRSTHMCTPQSGGRQTTSTQDETFTLQKRGDAWLINGVSQSAN